MYHFIATIHARPAESGQGGEIEVAGRRMRALVVPQATLAATPMSGPRRALCSVFGDLARNFQRVVDAIGEISDTARVWSQKDVLRLYEIWLKTGSPRAKNLLLQLGVSPTPVSVRVS